MRDRDKKRDKEEMKDWDIKRGREMKRETKR